MKTLFLILSLLSLKSRAQESDTLNGYFHKTEGEEIIYFSPLHQFANTALLTRANGNMPISWEAPAYQGNKKAVTYELLIGHSTGTSSGNRKFDVTLNGHLLFTILTPMQKKGYYFLSGWFDNDKGYTFIQQEYDLNGDAFGRLYITVPAALARKKVELGIRGQNENSRDWLMVFMYKKGLKIISEPTQLFTRKEDKRQLNIFIDNPYSGASTVRIKAKNMNMVKTLQKGYNKLNVPAYNKNFTGMDTILFVVNQKDTMYKVVELKPAKEYTFHIIHHSHNDIGYSHLQREVEKIQDKNIRDAIRWIENNKNKNEKPVWHVESLWAVENFLKIASKEETGQFVDAVKKGQLVLSANYANILTGLCQQEELNWALEYAKKLESQYDFSFQSAMITDIPGITRSGLLSYVQNNISYLSLGPNYVENLPDKGDRVGSVIKEQGDKVFYWKPERTSEKKLLVWTAGKGYSLFHGIPDSEKQPGWESRISQYCEELTNKNYPYDMVQLRYTQHSDNGPVDTLLCSFVENWNLQFSAPQLKISSFNALCKEFEEKYGSNIPVCTGEISPYWEDGAYSTATEEMESRELSIKTIALEKFAKEKNVYLENEMLFYRLHKNILLFHEHTWGSWCSISDPESTFSTEQWKVKKGFLDSAKYYYAQLSSLLSFEYSSPVKKTTAKKIVDDFMVDSLHGGLKTILVEGRNIVSSGGEYTFFEPVYALGINPMQLYRTKNIRITTLENSEAIKTIQVSMELSRVAHLCNTYTLMKKQGTLTCRVTFDKELEKNKESLHLAMPFNFNNPSIRYGSAQHTIQYNVDQLPGSNKEFICAEEKVNVQSEDLTITLTSPKVNLYEVGNIMDENKTNGAKVWKASNTATSNLFLYVFNNYWHTNYKAYQEGHFDFQVELSGGETKKN